MDKRKGIILAIVLFLIIGLGTFVFAGGSEDEGSGNGTITPQPDGGDDNDPTNPSDPTTEDDGNITEGEDKEDTTRPTGGNDNTDGDELVTDGEGENTPTTPTVDYKALLDELANMVETATSKEDLAEAEQFRKDNNITEENVATLNDETASKTYDEVIAILTDNNPPVVTPDDLNGSFTNKDSVAVEITDTTDVSYTLTINGEEVTDADLANLTEEGNYELTVTDSAFNSTTITFTVDRTNPVFTGIQNGHQYQEVTLGLTEKNIAEIEIYNRDLDKYYEFEEGMVLDEDGTYTAVATDKAGNTTGTVYFEVDGTAPVIIINGEIVEPTDETLYYNETIVITVDEKNLASFTSNGSDRTSSVLADGWTAKGESGYKLVLTDKAGNETTYTVVIDKTEIEVNHLYVLNNSHNDSDYNLTDENRYKVIGNGQELYVEYVLKEEFTSTPVITIGGQEFEMNCGTASWNDSLYKCDAHITITEDMKLENGEVIPFTITGVKDIAGNETTVTEENVTVTEKYGQVIYDNEKPIYSSLGLVNITHYIEDSKGDNLFVANVGDTLRVMISFDELLEVNPTVTLGGVTKEMHFDDAWTDYSYWADIKITEDMNLTDGNIDFVISGYADAAGNVGVDLTSSDIKNSSYTGVELDTTAPKLTLVGTEETYDNILRIEAGTEITLEDVLATATDASFDGEITVEPYEANFYANTGLKDDNIYGYDFSNGFDTRKPTGSRYNIYYKVTDKAGNTTKDVMILAISDTTAATITPNQDDNYHVEYGSEYSSVTAKVTDNVDKTITNYEPRVYIRYTYPSAEYNTGELYYNNTFNTTIPGYYLAIWDYTDSSGNISNTLKRWVIVSDTTAPVPTSFVMVGGSRINETGLQYDQYAKVGTTIYVYVTFDEKLGVSPTLDILDTEGNVIEAISGIKFNDGAQQADGTYKYTAYYKVTETDGLDGLFQVKVSNYEDLAGNTGDVLTNDDITLGSQKNIYIDKSNPTRVYSTLGFEYTDSSNKVPVLENGQTTYYVQPGDSFLYKIAFSERLQDGLIATIAGTDVSLEYLDYSEDLGYIYGGTYTVPSGLTEGERLEIVVSNIKDLAGNEYVDGTIVDVPTSNGRVAEFDNTPIKYNAVNFYVDNNEYQDGNTYYATYGSTLVAYIRTNELLKENPTFEFTYGDEKIVISGEDVEFIDEEKEEFTYLYRVRYTIPEDFEKIEEEVTLNITNIVDYAGNITDNGSTGITNRNRVFIDTLAPQVVELRFNSSNDNKNYANENHSVGIYLVVDEELAENPVFTINGIQYKMTEQKEVTNGYFYAATTKLPADTEEGELSFTITNVVDEFGNSTSFDNDDIKNDVGYNYVIFDTTDPVITKKVDTDLYLPEGSKLPELSDLISATDNIDGDVTANAYIHRYTNEGDYYFLEIYVKDACGNGEYPSSYAAFRIHFVTENNQTSVDSAELSTVSNTNNNEPSNGAIVGAIVNSFSEDYLMTDTI